jgi:hypothetical protein
MAVSYTDVNPDPVATGIVQSFGVGGPFAYGQVVPERMVAGKKFRYAKWTFADMVSAHHETKMPDNGPANVREHRAITWTTGLCEAHGLKEQWGDPEARESALMGMAADHEMAIWEDLRNEIGLGIEAELKTQLEAASNATTCTTTQQWDDSSADILGTFRLAIRKMRHNSGLNPNVVIIPEDCWDVLLADTTVQGRLPDDADDRLTMNEGVPLILKGCRVIVPTRLINSANPGATASIAEQWSSDKVYFMHVNMAAANDPRVPTAAFLASSMTLPGATWAANSWRPNDLDCHWTNYAVEKNYKLILQDELIYRLDDVLE